MVIRKYNKEHDEDNLMALLKDEGQEWACYWADDVSEKYRAALKTLLHRLANGSSKSVYAK